MPPRPGYIPELDGLRALAITLVVIAHLPEIVDAPLWNALKMAAGGFQIGYLGVDVFFVLSGFLITRLLLARLGEPSHRILADFYWRRILRILPAFLLCLGYCVVVFPLPMAEVLANLLFVSNYYYAVVPDPSPLRHTWSLSVEEQFYLIWPATLLIIGPALVRRWALVATFGIVVVCGLSFATLASAQVGDMMLVRATPYRILSLVAGALFAFHEDKLRRLPLWPLLVLAGLACPAVQLSLRLWGGPGAQFANLFVASAWSASIFLIFCRATWHGGLVHRAATWPPVIYLGRISYGLYLYHFVALYQLSLRDGMGSPPATALPVLAALVLVLAVTIASYHLVERPFLDWRGRAFRAPAAFTPARRRNVGKGGRSR